MQKATYTRHLSSQMESTALPVIQPAETSKYVSSPLASRDFLNITLEWRKLNTHQLKNKADGQGNDSAH